MILEKGVADEVIVLQDFEIQINIADLIDHINNNESQYQVLECTTNQLLGLNRTDGINNEVLGKMNKERSNQPILVTAIDEYEWIIDGNHRLLKRAQLGKELTSYIPINRNQLNPYVSTFSWRL
ncbi:hypothetical protein AB835_05595 [Candidatus Endobugula sertula]|uniref:ParB/Sulfiredoxin domain-containing protein n=1 Tax=Candidatus Endobugula sertula TaxID=62101 RepID=A0A1D2QRD2_9GAMM|nr:hypothetical protein AB835_05595 [Candidatus Endobugula sertula]